MSDINDKTSTVVDNKAATKTTDVLGTKQFNNTEFKYIKKWRETSKRASDAELTGLALSGGGIRSATFSLGILQALAKHNLLKKFDYISTVSGGGYIGSALNWALREHTTKYPINESANLEDKEDKDLESNCLLDEKNFPFGTEDPQSEKFNYCDTSGLCQAEEDFHEESKSDVQAGQQKADKNGQKTKSNYLKFLRTHGRYLDPGDGTNLLTLFNAVLRGTLLNLFIWVPFIALLFLLALKLSTFFSLDGSYLDFVGGLLFESYEEFSAFLIPPFWLFEWFFRAAIYLTISLFILLFIYSIFTRFSRDKLSPKGKAYKLQKNIGKIISRTFKLSNRDDLFPDGIAYEYRRAIEKTATAAMLVVCILLIISTLPLANFYLADKFAAFGSLAVLVGIGILFKNFITGLIKTKLPTGILVTLGAFLFIYGLLLVSLQLAIYLQGTLEPIFIIPIVIFVAILGYVVNINYIAIHRYYRDRLMESFMPNLDVVENEEMGNKPATGANKAYLADFAKNVIGPYPIINTNAILVDSENTKYQNRGGDNFILSPYYCGSKATGWVKTEQYMGGKMTMATAMAISAAAVNPNTGVGGEGISRNPLISLVMSLLNLRLGYWAHNPQKAPKVNKYPNHFYPGFYAFFNFFPFWQGNSENRSFIELSDGGHFENTAVYELVRRKVKLIVVCDGGQDKEFSFSDFQTTIRRIEDDFDVKVAMDSKYNPDAIVPQIKPGMDYPLDTGFAKRGFTLAKITYKDNTEAYIIYLKTTLQEDVSFKVKGYKAQNKDFPDETTTDQFFDEVQFEAYRELGYRIASKMIKELELKDINSLLGKVLN
ncbi:MAG: patatin-like phospholipase family protein [Pseudomonadota bacterium]